MSRFWEFAQLSDAFKNASYFDSIPHVGNLYIGGVAALHQEPDPLKEAGVTHVISALDYDVKDERQLLDYKHMWIQIDDLPSENLLQHFRKTNKFIEDAMLSQGAVFVHCAMGVSRSATIVCAYLMWKKSVSAHSALEQLREGRQRCQPNPGFSEQLEVYEEMLKARTESDADAIYLKWVGGSGGKINGNGTAQGKDSKL